MESARPNLSVSNIGTDRAGQNKVSPSPTGKTYVVRLSNHTVARRHSSAEGGHTHIKAQTVRAVSTVAAAIHALVCWLAAFRWFLASFM